MYFKGNDLKWSTCGEVSKLHARTTHPAFCCSAIKDSTDAAGMTVSALLYRYNCGQEGCLLKSTATTSAIRLLTNGTHKNPVRTFSNNPIRTVSFILGNLCSCSSCLCVATLLFFNKAAHNPAAQTRGSFLGAGPESTTQPLIVSTSVLPSLLCKSLSRSAPYVIQPVLLKV
ncbi:hypothetical protein GOP47_0024398 [Adiantum capillus-veneris]|uniref:Uncharacterized protein n=1 Tax=Adiantum capillus-veneris TaxID=13818 RepID=A0A9D4Z2R0_ADICA|nr:hypothetical protein GOP47_0024398 [Adiantum capillus-veneris]